ncbi:MAG: tetratricopeptide repeat protein [Acidobacteriota bacterium]|nr:tetratricopeptide repeat protein [Acidobacteriota bacterium]
MDTQTRHALKGDKLAKATQSSMDWMSDHRSNVVRWSIAGGAVLVVVIAALIFWNVSNSGANDALGAAMDVYDAPLVQPGVPKLSGEYDTSAERAKAANDRFVAVAKKYGWLPQGSQAQYFAGVTYEDLGQNDKAEAELKEAAGSWNKNLANLAKLALAGLYRQTNRQDDAIKLYNQLIAKPSDTVPATAAQLNLADLYAAAGKQQEARLLWAKVKDADKDGAAGAIAAQKLAPAQ